MRKPKREDLTEFGGLRVVWLEAFVRSVEAKSRVAAAAQMGIDQATLTKHIKKLEDWLARGRLRPLVEYQVWPFRLTKDGEEFLQQAVVVLETLRRARIAPVETPAGDDAVDRPSVSSSETKQGEG